MSPECLIELWWGSRGMSYFLWAESHQPMSGYLVSMRPGRTARGMGINKNIGLLEF